MEWEFDLNYEHLDNYINAAAKQWAETEKTNNQYIGASRADQELAFRDAIVSQKSESIGKIVKYFWVTVNPQKDTPLPQLITTIHKMYKKKWIENAAYVFETTSGSHNHSHGLIKANYEAARARKELASTVSKICNVTNQHCFKFVILNEEQAREKMDYMLGKKKTSKMADVALTNEWRKEHSLKEMYSSESPLILLDSRNVVSRSDGSSQSP